MRKITSPLPPFPCGLVVHLTSHSDGNIHFMAFPGARRIAFERGPLASPFLDILSAEGILLAQITLHSISIVVPLPEAPPNATN